MLEKAKAITGTNQLFRLENKSILQNLSSIGLAPCMATMISAFEVSFNIVGYLPLLKAAIREHLSTFKNYDFINSFAYKINGTFYFWSNLQCYVPITVWQQVVIYGK